jgi:hypothetical protein
MTSIVFEMGHKVAGNESVATCTCGSVYCRLIRVLYCARLYVRVYPAVTSPGSYIIPEIAWRCQAAYDQRDCSSCVCFCGVWESHHSRLSPFMKVRPHSSSQCVAQTTNQRCLLSFPGLSSAIGAQCARPRSIYSESLTTRRISEADIDVGRGVASGEEGARKGRLGFMWRKGAATQKRATGPSTTATNVQRRIQEDATLLIKLSEVSSLDPICMHGRVRTAI